ncbi:hypothetical protein [Variovorax sp. OV329]|uniref:hypothetical protein n=1 Tax=Variovorax sp. OV329 TaxID=1882825 RepID=UPI0008DED792|nr:hypothetical protein [Variovorax sp. OV329]SFL95670.1 hypothetical protein SAMN05444747_101450 [Variovorax sp. OV329]
MSTNFESFIAELRTLTQGAALAVDADQSGRRRRLSDAIALRVGAQERRVAPETVLEQASARYFALIARVQGSLKGRFSEKEWAYILEIDRKPIWNWWAGTKVATLVADNHDVSSLDDPALEGALRVLLYKLLQLSPLENAALVDACEQVWRGCRNPLLEE